MSDAMSTFVMITGGGPACCGAAPFGPPRIGTPPPSGTAREKSGTKGCLRRLADELVDGDSVELGDLIERLRLYRLARFGLGQRLRADADRYRCLEPCEVALLTGRCDGPARLGRHLDRVAHSASDCL